LLRFQRWLQENDCQYPDQHVSAEAIVIHLLPQTQYGGRFRKAVLPTLTALNAQDLGHPYWPGKQLKFRLGQRGKLAVKMKVLTD
jgi:hypothetical protein